MQFVARRALSKLIKKRLSSSKLQETAYNLSKFNQYGLMRDDVRDEDDEDVAAALERLPQDARDQRNYRILRAVQLDIQKTILPQKEWMTLEKDVLYLTPIIKDIEREKKEQWEWNKNN